ncbi:MAG: MOSC domain-containing protein [Acidimicrobiia bacterium]|nr:MOSC domain-containing protein [Acidimicrobiia bacterium]
MHRSTEELQGFLDNILAAPTEQGRIEMIVRRPESDQREVVDSARLDTEQGLIGDNWRQRVDDRGNPYLHAQLTLMNSRVADAVAVERERWALAGDQIYVDMNLSIENLPPGSKIRVGEAVVEISETPHTGCPKFAARFGKDALRFANVGVGRENRFRGVNAFIVESGEVRVGDKVARI